MSTCWCIFKRMEVFVYLSSHQNIISRQNKVDKALCVHGATSNQERQIITRKIEIMMPVVKSPLKKIKTGYTAHQHFNSGCLSKAQLWVSFSFVFVLFCVIKNSPFQRPRFSRPSGQPVPFLRHQNHLDSSAPDGLHFSYTCSKAEAPVPSARTLSPSHIHPSGLSLSPPWFISTDHPLPWPSSLPLCFSDIELFMLYKLHIYFFAF